MGWHSILSDWPGGTVLVAFALGCAGAELLAGRRRRPAAAGWSGKSTRPGW